MTQLLAEASTTVEPWVWDVIQALLSVLLTVVGLYLGSIVKRLREDVRALNKLYSDLSKDHVLVDKRLVSVETACNERHGERATARAGG